MKYEHTKPNVAGFTSQVQRDEMTLILAGMWPPLKPLPVFKYGTDEYRAEIHFDRTRGEWVCRKTSLPSNKVQELRGGLTEMTMALPHGQADVFTEAVEAEPQEQESENEANRRLQAILEWQENCGNGALYSELQDYLSESQQDEIYDSIRMTLTARQLQFNPKNVEFVFDALWNAGGRLAILIEMAQRNKAEREADVQAPRHEGMFPSESTHVKRTITVDGIKLQQWPLPIPAASHSDAGHSVVGSPTGISTGDLPQSLEASFPSERARHFVPEPIKTSIPELSESLTAESVDGFIPTTLENFPTEPIGSVSPVAREILEAVFVLLFAVIGFTVGLTVGRGPLGRSLRDTQNSILAADVTSPAPPNRPGETTSPTSTPPAADTFDTPAVNPPSPETEELRPESTSSQSLNARPADSVIRVRPTGPSSAVTSRSHIDSDHSSGANKLDDTPPSEEKSKEGTRDSYPSVKVPSTDSNSSPTTESKASAIPEASPERSGSTGLIERNALPAASPKPAHSPKVVGSSADAPRRPAPRTVTPATGAALHPSPPSAILVTAPAKGSNSFRLTLPEKPLAASPSFAITSQLSVFVSPEPGPGVAHQPVRLQAGDLVSYVWPRYPRLGDRYGSTETVKVRAIIGQLGQVLDVKLVSGSISLLPAAMSAIRRWRYKPTLLNERPVQTQQDVTIEFRPPKYLSHVRTQSPSHK
jgi:TonB family protein